MQVVFRSGSAEWLALPWELMRDPADGVPLALAVGGMDRSLPSEDLGATFEVPGGRLRVLMVISRPGGAVDVGFQMIARPLLARLEAVRGNVDLVLLRPPTLDALDAKLAAARVAGEPFQIVHFDGHGILEQGRAVTASAMPQDSSMEGKLVFQLPDGNADPVPAAEIARVLAAAQVPVVVLNACQSGSVDKQLEAAVATRLLQAGAESVVAMAYSVYANAAAEFMAAFYEKLFAGESVSRAVTAGRHQLFRHSTRPSPRGEMPLADWVVPVHYLRHDVSFPELVATRHAASPAAEAGQAQPRDVGRWDGAGMLAPVETFTGRDSSFLELETAARQQRVLVLHGQAGTGKTELAKAFGRWWADTGGVDRPEWVFWHSFEPGLASFSLSGAISDIGLAIHGPGFARLHPDERTATVEQFLREQRALLLWDNFEAVHSMPEPAMAAPPLDDAGRQQLQGFLSRMAAARSTVLITSRTPETWLDDVTRERSLGQAGSVKLRRIRIAGLLPQEAAEYASRLLAPYPAASHRRASRAFGDLMEWLDGHPLSMRLILPLVRTTDPQVLLDGMQGIVPLPESAAGGSGGTASLSVSLSYSFAQLNPADQQLLVAVCLFHSVVDAQVLAMLSRVAGAPERFAGVPQESWTNALGSATERGLLTRIGSGLYRIHPALPAYLAAVWRDQEQAAYQPQRAAGIQALLAAYAALGVLLSLQIASGDAGGAYTTVGLHQRTMGHLLGYAVDNQRWSELSSIVQPLDDFWDARGMYAEAAAWTDRACHATEDRSGQRPPLGTAAGDVWLFLTGSQANRLIRLGSLDAAERMCSQILDAVQGMSESPDQRNSLAVAYGQLGRIAIERGRHAEAENWYLRSVALFEELGEQPRAAIGYHQLGMVAQERGQLAEAETWYGRALPIFEQIGDRPGMAATCHQLGIVAQIWGRLEDAEDLFIRSLSIQEELGDRPALAIGYHQLGEVAHLRARLDQAKAWYIRSLAIKDELGDRPGNAPTYHQLGILAQDQRQLEEAQAWHAHSLDIYEELGDRLGMASSYHQLGEVAQERGELERAEACYTRSLAIKEEHGDKQGLMLTYYQRGLLSEAQGKLAEALEWHVRCVALSAEVPHLRSGPAPGHLARLTYRLGVRSLYACWQRVTGHPLPAAVLDYASAYHPQVDGSQEDGGQ